MKVRLSRTIAILFVILLSFSSVTILNVKAQPRTITVPDDYLTIQEAINNANDGDTISVKNGVYIENPIINKTINLKGENKETTIIDVTAGIKAKNDQVTITGFTIYDGHDGISLATNNCTITNNIIKESTHGIVIFGTNNLIEGNTFEAIGLSSAIQLNFANNNTIKNNIIESCVEGIQIWQNSNNNTITENTIRNCQDTAINFQYSNNNQLIGNNITNCGLGTSIYGSNNNSIINNNYVNNTIQFGASEWYYLTFGNPRSNNTINKNYWSDYNGIDQDEDGIGDSPYIIDDNNQDNYPLMTPISSWKLIFPPAPEPEFPTTIVLTSVVILGIVGLGIFVYFKKRKT